MWTWFGHFMYGTWTFVDSGTIPGRWNVSISDCSNSREHCHTKRGWVEGKEVRGITVTSRVGEKNSVRSKSTRDLRKVVSQEGNSGQLLSYC